MYHGSHFVGYSFQRYLTPWKGRVLGVGWAGRVHRCTSSVSAFGQVDIAFLDSPSELFTILTSSFTIPSTSMFSFHGAYL